VTFDRDEILVVGEVGEVELHEDATGEARAEARAGRVKRFREETRGERMAIARDAEHRFGRKVAWGASSGGDRYVFTSLALPVMTRLRMTERKVLDTLVDAGVARSRSDALAWCVRLVRKNEDEWLSNLRAALGAVEKARAEGPASA